MFPKSPFLIDPMVYPPLGLWYLAAQLEALGHHCEYFDLSEDDLPNDGDFDQLWVSGTSAQMHEIRKLGEIFSAWSRTTTVVGGPAAWTKPASLMDIGYRIVVIGEADHPKQINKILDMHGHRGYLYCDVQSSIDHVLPPIRRWSRRYIAHLEGKLTATMFTSRGCPMSCAFCESGRDGVIWSRIVRYEPVSIVAAQLREIKGLDFGAVQFYDDILPLNKPRMLEIISLLKEYGLIWRCFIRTDIICKQGGREYLKEMADGGLVEVLAGIESADNRIKDNVSKGTTIEQDTQVLQWCKELGIKFKGSFILGLPGEDRDSLNRTRDWILKYKPDRADINTLIPFPGTPLVDNMEEYDIYITEDVPEEFWYKGHRSRCQSIVGTSHLTPEEIGAFRNDLVRELETLNIPY